MAGIKESLQLSATVERPSDWLVRASKRIQHAVKADRIEFRLTIAPSLTAIVLEWSAILSGDDESEEFVQHLAGELTKHLVIASLPETGLNFDEWTDLCAAGMIIAVNISAVELGNTARRKRSYRSLVSALSEYLKGGTSADQELLRRMLDRNKFVFVHSETPLRTAQLCKHRRLRYKNQMKLETRTDRKSAEQTVPIKHGGETLANLKSPALLFTSEEYRLAASDYHEAAIECVQKYFDSLAGIDLASMPRSELKQIFEETQHVLQEHHVVLRTLADKPLFLVWSEERKAILDRCSLLPDKSLAEMTKFPQAVVVSIESLTISQQSHVQTAEETPSGPSRTSRRQSGPRIKGHKRQKS